MRHPGSEPLHLALELSVLAAARGHPLHVHVEGLRGTGKTTIIRAAARLLPHIVRIAGCPYNCDPARPHCPLHRELAPSALRALPTEAVPAPFLEISPSAKIGTVVGSVDLARLTDADRPQAALLPGTLARAHRGVVFVDEINRLADASPELADALLDVMGTKPGRLQIEEAGLPQIVLECRATIWAASNPDEEPGPLCDIRRQLADRFDVSAAMRRPAEPPAVLAVLAAATLRPESSLPGAAAAVAEPEEGEAGLGLVRPDPTARLRQDLAAAAVRPAPGLPPALGERLARAYCDFQVESLRAVQAWQAAARLRALRAGRAEADLEDCRSVAPLVLRHRLETEELARLLGQLDPVAPAAEALAAAVPVAPAPPTAAGAPEADPAAELRDPRPAPAGWWQRITGGGGARAARGAAVPAGDPAQMPPIVPRTAARFLPELAPPELLLPAETPPDGTC